MPSVGDTQISRQGLTCYDFVEHPAKDPAVEVSGMNREADESARDLIHDHQHPVTRERNRRTTENIYAPQAVFHVSEEG